MQFRYDPEHLALRESVRRLLTDGSPETAAARLGGEIGAFGLAIPEGYGGSGAGLIELGIVFHESGRTLLDAPLAAAAMASTVLLSSGDPDACRELLPGIASGETVVAVAHLDTAGPISAEPNGDGWVLTGGKDWVADGSTAHVLLVTAETDSGGAVFLVDPAGPGVRTEPMTTVDVTRRFATATFTSAPARLIGPVGSLPAIDAPLRATMLVLLAAEQTGIAERTLELATEYAKTREQFGKPIGSFQAIKHKLASVALELEAATSAEMFALWSADHDPDALETVARIAAYTCSEAAMLACSECIQVHGGIGATWEHPAHRYLRRATVNRQLFGGPQDHLAALADHLAPA